MSNLITFSLKVDVSSREFKLFFLVSDNGMIMGNGDPPGKKTEKRKKMVKVERVNFLGSEVWGLADVRWEAGRMDGWREVARGRGHVEVDREYDRSLSLGSNSKPRSC